MRRYSSHLTVIAGLAVAVILLAAGSGRRRRVSGPAEPGT